MHRSPVWQSEVAQHAEPFAPIEHVPMKLPLGSMQWPPDAHCASVLHAAPSAPDAHLRLPSPSTATHAWF
jgi:hypothetical protein